MWPNLQESELEPFLEPSPEKEAYPPKKRHRIEEAIEKLDFRPSSVAQSLSSRKLGIVGLLLPKLSGAFYELILRTAEDELRAHRKYFVMATGTGDSQEKESFEFLLARDCDGMLVFSSEISERSLLDLESRFPNIAIMNRIVPTIEDKCFVADHFEGGRLAAQTLIDAGHSRIAVITGPQHRLDARLRQEGFASELATAGIRLDEDLVFEGDFGAVSGRYGCDRLLETAKPFSAVFCSNDTMAMAALSRLQQRGRQVPSDVAVLGYDNLEYGAFLAPPLTTIDSAIEATVRNACRYLLNVCYGIESDFYRQFQPNVVWRQSV